MLNKKVTLLDYGLCNLLNVARAFEHVGADVLITEDPSIAVMAERLVVPGVGAFRDSILEVEARGFDDAIKRFIKTDRPFLGICVGMQMLFDSSEEFGDHLGLGIFSGDVKAIPKKTSEGISHRIPHIGWNHLIPPEMDRDWDETLLEQFKGKHPAVYFVHSFAADPKDSTIRLADTLYGGHRVCAAVQKNNIMATQFHPERSGEIGLNILNDFLRY
ncbi:MAG: imidazole glycerol phosphate synthase subunit HisH [Gammaproteobacteria bacterium]|nr:MAG: imidazole glycerol phosphate synthase subunit HisH [Gammaproteobacteria bacterium]